MRKPRRGANEPLSPHLLRLARLVSAAAPLLACTGAEETTATTASTDTDAVATTPVATTTPASTSSTASTGTTGPATTADPTDPSSGSDSRGESEGETAPPPACPGGGLGPGDHTIQLTHDGMARSFNLHVPPSYDPGAPTPLVVNFHGLTSNAGQQAFFSGMTPLADAEGFLLAYPEGHMSSWNAGECCGGAQSAGVDDVGFARALVAEIQAITCVDERRIFATGMSNGGFMTNRLACAANDLFAAFAPVSAVLVTEPCLPARPVPIMAFNGTLDTLVSYNGGLFLGAPATFLAWAERNGCVGEPVQTFQKGAATCETFDDCEDGVTVTLCTIDPMGHCWPGQSFCPFIPANTDISANQEMWKFFQEHPLP
ncbi:MAG: prolyl oligopeptidase family serine peptidase [Nannocystis sp.]|nr:prolyl oligopeptidase family serine peptidase [Nannocystis sp.]